MSVQVCEEAYVACVELLLPHIFYLFIFGMSAFMEVH